MNGYIGRKIPEYVGHAFHADVLGQLVGTLLLIFYLLQEVLVCLVQLYHKIENRQVKPHDIMKVGQQLGDSVRTIEKVFNPYSVNYA